MAKAAIHHLVKSLAEPDKSGLPEATFTAAILPITLDTPMNRKWMPNAGSYPNPAFYTCKAGSTATILFQIRLLGRNWSSSQT